MRITRALLLAASLLPLGSLSACRQSSGQGEHATGVPSARPAGELLAAGAPAPDLRATAHTGEAVDLGALRGRPVVVYFYPKDDTPGCTVEAQEIRDLWSELQTTSAIVLGVSTDDAPSHQQFAQKHALPFLLLPDTDHRIASAFGVPLKNGRARRVTFLIDRQGKVARVFPEVKPEGHARELLEAIRALG
jgi:thioredoxin-dependent peroxiredoxin